MGAPVAYKGDRSFLCNKSCVCPVQAPRTVPESEQVCRESGRARQASLGAEGSIRPSYRAGQHATSPLPETYRAHSTEVLNKCPVKMRIYSKPWTTNVRSRRNPHLHKNDAQKGREETSGRPEPALASPLQLWPAVTPTLGGGPTLMLMMVANC